MARQTGPVLLRGTIGGITFYKTKDGYLAKKKSNIPKSRIEEEPNFKRTRENAAGFSHACTAAKFLRLPFKDLLHRAGDITMSGRLTRLFVRVVQSDWTNPPGKRCVMNGDLAIIKGFEFNANCPLGTLFRARYFVKTEGTTGLVQVVIPACIPAFEITAPAAATHFKIIARAAAINFDTGSYEADGAETAYFPASGTSIITTALPAHLPAGNQQPVFVLMKLVFSQEVNGVYCPLPNGSGNATAIVEVMPLAGTRQTGQQP